MKRRLFILFLFIFFFLSSKSSMALDCQVTTEPGAINPDTPKTKLIISSDLFISNKEYYVRFPDAGQVKFLTSNTTPARIEIWIDMETKTVTDNIKNTIIPNPNLELYTSLKNTGNHYFEVNKDPGSNNICTGIINVVAPAAKDCLVNIEPGFLTQVTPNIRLIISSENFATNKGYFVNFLGAGQAQFITSYSTPARIEIGIDMVNQTVTDNIKNTTIPNPNLELYTLFKNEGSHYFEITKDPGRNYLCSNTININKGLFCRDLAVTNNKVFKLGDKVDFAGKINGTKIFGGKTIIMKVFDGSGASKGAFDVSIFEGPDANGLLDFYWSYDIPEGVPGKWTIQGVYWEPFKIGGDTLINNCSLNFGVNQDITQPTPQPPSVCPLDCKLENCPETRCQKCSFCGTGGGIGPGGPIDLSAETIKRLCENTGMNSDEKGKCSDCFKLNNHVWTALGCMSTEVSGLVSNFFKIGLGLAGGIAFLFIIFGGFTILTSAGNPDRITQGKDMLVSAISGLLLIIFSVFILQLIAVDILKLPGFGKSSTGCTTSQKECNYNNNKICCNSNQSCGYQDDGTGNVFPVCK